jgi:hypothetical protein
MPTALLEMSGALELRASGRTLRAEMPYGERARDRAEQFAPRSLALADPTRLNLQHDRGIELASTADATLRLTDTDEALEIEADLRGAALELVQRRRLTGVSLEFRARAERRTAGLRIITAADVDWIGLVDVGSYATPLELRAAARRRVWL